MKFYLPEIFQGDFRDKRLPMLWNYVLHATDVDESQILALTKCLQNIYCCDSISISHL